MMLPSRMNVLLAGVFGIVLTTGALLPRARADAWDKRTSLTVNQPIEVQDIVLQPGTYVLKLLNSNSDRHIVQIFNGDQTHVIDTILAIPNYRLQPTGNSQFAFWETPPGNARALRAWFYPGDNYGQEFRYPQRLYALATASAAGPPPPLTPQLQPELDTRELEPEPGLVETAQNVPPPARTQAPPPTPAEQAPAAQAAPPASTQEPPPSQDQPPSTLPETGSPYPLIGLAGLFLLGLFGLLRLKRSA
jgi:LPXTG-motif cell wall-anchored protein